MTQRDAHITLVQHKDIDDAPLLKATFPQFPLYNCESIEIIGYHIAEGDDPLPSYLLLTFDNDETGMYFSIRDNKTSDPLATPTLPPGVKDSFIWTRTQKNAFVLYPPGGATTQNIIVPLSIKFGNQTRSLHNVNFKLEVYDPNIGEFRDFTDFRTCIIQLRVVCRPYHPVRKGLN